MTFSNEIVVIPFSIVYSWKRIDWIFQKLNTWSVSATELPSKLLNGLT